MLLHYLFHSGFAIEGEQAIVIMDYFEDTVDENHGFVHDVLLRSPKRIYVLASHFHPDHFNPQVLTWREIHPDTVYLLSNDIYRHHRARRDDAIFLKRFDTYSDELISVKAYGSTDSGDSFFFTFEGVTFFHAGDLNNWHFADESTPQEVRKAESDYLAELKRIRTDISQVDVTMFPVDRRLGNNYAKGAKQFLETIKSAIFVPMHGGGEYEGGNAFCSEAPVAGVIYLPVHSRGDNYDIIELLNNKQT
jgi:L-ascorbate metabolism protein UlaG (beta-lactamase superfamily)